MADVTLDDLYNLIGRKDAMLLQLQKEIDSLRQRIAQLTEQKVAEPDPTEVRDG